MRFPIDLHDWCYVLFVIVIVESNRPDFRADYRYEKGFNAFYKVHHIAASWWEARMRCEGEGAKLIVPENLDEADAMPLLISTILNKYDGVFIGIHDLYCERSFVTIAGLDMLDSIMNLLWEYGHPVPKAGRCIGMRHNGRLFVRQCHDRLPFICKVKAKDIQYRKDCDTFDPRWTPGPNDTCYLHHEEPQNWFDAFATCQAAGGNLAVMNSRAEAEYTRGIFKKVAERRLPSNDFAFIGFNDLFQRYQYRTVFGDSLSKCGYTDWAVTCGRKQNATGARRCGGIRRSGLLALGDCRLPAMFICEKKTKATSDVDETTTKKPRKTKKKKHSK